MGSSERQGGAWYFRNWTMDYVKGASEWKESFVPQHGWVITQIPWDFVTRVYVEEDEWCRTEDGSCEDTVFRVYVSSKFGNKAYDGRHVCTGVNRDGESDSDEALAFFMQNMPQHLRTRFQREHQWAWKKV